MPKSNKIQRVYVVYYDFKNPRPDGIYPCTWMITTDEEEAKALNGMYQLASIDDLHDWICAVGGSGIFDGIVETSDGQCVWVVTQIHDPITEEEEMFCEYRLLTGIFAPAI